MTTTLDIAALVSAIVWPILILAVLIIFRGNLPTVAEWLSSRVKKLEFAGISLELAVAKPFVPDLSVGSIDLRHSAVAIQIGGSGAPTILRQLAEEGAADYAEVNLGTGNEWLTSRLFILTILFARMKGIKCFVFVETLGAARKRFVGWAEPEKIRWALAKHYPWLEQSYVGAYSSILSQQGALIITNEGGLGSPYSARDAGPSVNLLGEFLNRIQAPGALAPDSANWVLLNPQTPPPVPTTYEHAHWISSERLEQILGSDLKVSTIPSVELRSKNSSEQMRSILSQPGKFVVVTSAERRFEYLIDRHVILEMIGKKLVLETDGRS